jgi:hypothetical protein
MGNKIMTDNENKSPASGFQSDNELLDEFKAALEEGSNIDSLPYEIIKKLILRASEVQTPEHWKGKISDAINSVFRVRIGTFDRLTYMMIKTHMENVIKQTDVPNVQLIKYGKDTIIESLMSFSEILEKIGEGGKNKKLNSISFGKTINSKMTKEDVIASIRAYKLEGKTWEKIDEIMGVGRNALSTALMKYEREELQKNLRKEESLRGLEDTNEEDPGIIGH